MSSSDETILQVISSDGKKAYIKSKKEDIGKRVIIELNNNKSIGIVVGEVKKHEEICENFYFPDGDFQILTEEMIKLCYRMKEKYFCKISDALRLMCPPEFLKLSVVLCKKEGVPNIKLFQVLKKSKKISLSKAKRLSKNLLKLEREGFIKIVPTQSIKTKEEVLKEVEKEFKSINEPKIELTEDQKRALEILDKAEKVLIHGATGSGKTEIYIQAIKKYNGGAIFLLPEISLTTFLLSRLRERFEKISILHSGITKKQRITHWFALRYGITNIAVGARSALFSPVQNLKLIIIDEEHDPSYKQNPDSGDVFYDARELAFMRAEIEKAKVILGSATPSVETYYKAKEKKELELIEIKRRIPGMLFPKIEIIDLRETPLEEFISFPLSLKLKYEIEKRIDSSENSILLFTRRGWALSVICTTCGHKFKCSQCDRALVYHKSEEMVCHWCGRRYNVPTVCSKCGSEKLELIGFGTERIEEELKSIFKVPVFRMDSDKVKSEKQAKEILNNFLKTRPSILLGTQMVAKGFDFPSVTLVGVLLADTEFLLPDFKADERAFSLFVQVAGRSGRKIGTRDSRDISIIQTYSPDHPVIKYAVEMDYEKFFQEEIDKRREFNLPPFTDIGVINFSSPDEQKCWAVAQSFDEKLKSIGIEYEKPTKSLRYIIEKKYNVKIILYLREKDTEKLRRLFKACKFFIDGVKITLDISPQSIL